MVDDIKTEKLSDYSKVKPFQISAKTQADAEKFLELLQLTKPCLTFKEFAQCVDTSNPVVFLKYTVVLDTRIQLAALQYVFSVRRNKLNVSLLWEGPTSQKRYSNFQNRIAILKDVASGNLSDELKQILNSQPVFTEYT